MISFPLGSLGIYPLLFFNYLLVSGLRLTNVYYMSRQGSSDGAVIFHFALHVHPVHQHQTLKLDGTIVHSIQYRPNKEPSTSPRTAESAVSRAKAERVCSTLSTRFGTTSQTRSDPGRPSQADMLHSIGSWLQEVICSQTIDLHLA
jgi:hypothetical protein